MGGRRGHHYLYVFAFWSSNRIRKKTIHEEILQGPIFPKVTKSKTERQINICFLRYVKTDVSSSSPHPPSSPAHPFLALISLRTSPLPSHPAPHSCALKFQRDGCVLNSILFLFLLWRKTWGQRYQSHRGYRALGPKVSKPPRLPGLVLIKGDLKFKISGLPATSGLSHTIWSRGIQGIGAIGVAGVTFDYGKSWGPEYRVYRVNRSFF